MMKLFIILSLVLASCIILIEVYHEPCVTQEFIKDSWENEKKLYLLRENDHTGEKSYRIDGVWTILC